MAIVGADLSATGARIEVRFPVRFVRGEPDEETERLLGAMRTVAGRRFDKAQSIWTTPVDWQSALELRRAFGKELRLGGRLAAWGRKEKARQDQLRAASSDDTAVLDWLPRTAPALYEAIHLGPKGVGMAPGDRVRALQGPASFQAADVRFMVDSPNPLNANHMGLGKTIEAIATIEEAGLNVGPILVVAPVSAAEGTWPEELRKWQDRPVWLARGTAKEKRATHEEFTEWVSKHKADKTVDGTGYTPGNPGWLIVNPEQIQLREEVEKCEEHERLNVKTVDGKKVIKSCSDRGDKMDEEELFFNPCCLYREYFPYPELHRIPWNAVIWDEAHEHGVLNPKSLTGRGARKVKAKKTIMLTGTPMGGREIRLFEILQFLRPDVFTSKWRFAEQYLEIGETQFHKRGGRGEMGSARTIGGIRRCPTHRMQGIRPPKGECSECDRHEQYFFDQLTPYVLRRTKDEVLKELPPKQYVELWCPFGSEAHRKQYETFAKDAEVAIEGKRVTAVNVISEYTRLGQFAWGAWKRSGTDMVPTADSGKLQVLEGKLEELGIFDKDGSEQAVIFSQYKTIVNVIYEWLLSRGVSAGRITGDTTRRGERAATKESFQGEGGLRVLVVSTAAGGTSLTLDRASHVFMMDDSWNPDRDEQAEDRCHRASRIHQVTIYKLRTSGTIDEYKKDVAWEKAIKNRNVLDLRRIKLRADS